MTAFGWVATPVESSIAGSETTAAASAGATVLAVASLGDFASQGYLDIGQVGLPLAYTATTATGADAGTVTLAAALMADVAEGVRVDVWDADGANSKPRTSYTVGFIFDGDSTPTSVNLPPELVPLFTDDGQVYCEVSKEPDGWWVKRPRDRIPTVHAGFTRPGTFAMSTGLDQTDAADNDAGGILHSVTNWFGKVFRGASFIADDGNGNKIVQDGPRVRWEIWQGNALTSFISATASRFGGILSARRITVDERSEFRGDVVVQPDTYLQFFSTLQPPAEPIVSVAVPFIVTTPAPTNAARALTYSAGSAYFVRTRSSNAGTLVELRSFDPTEDGESTLVWSAPLAANTLIHGLMIGSDVLTFVTTGVASYAVQVRDPATGDILSQWPVTAPLLHTSPCMGTDGTNVLICWTHNSVDYIIEHYSTSGTPGASVTTDTGYGIAGDVLGGSFDYGTPRYVIRELLGTQFDVYDATGIEQPDEAWDSPIDILVQESIGLAYDGTDFLELAPDGSLFRYSQTHVGAYPTAPDTTVGLTWRSSTEQTVLGAQVTFNLPPRSTATITAPPIPTFRADRAALFITDTASPVRTNFHLFGTPAIGDDSWVLDAALSFAGANPPAASSFATGISGIKDDLGTVLLDSSGYVAGGGGSLGVEDDVYIGSDYIEITGRV